MWQRLPSVDQTPAHSNAHQMHIGRTTIVLQHYPAGIADGGQQCRSRESTPRRVSSKYLGRQFFSSDFIGPVGAVAESCEGGRHIVEFGSNLIYIEIVRGGSGFIAHEL